MKCPIDQPKGDFLTGSDDDAYRSGYTYGWDEDDSWKNTIRFYIDQPNPDLKMKIWALGWLDGHEDRKNCKFLT